MYKGGISHELMGKSGKVELEIDFTRDTCTGKATYIAKDAATGWNFKIKADIHGVYDEFTHRFNFRSTMSEVKYEGETHNIYLIGEGSTLDKPIKGYVKFYSNDVLKGAEQVIFEKVE